MTTNYYEALPSKGVVVALYQVSIFKTVRERQQITNVHKLLFTETDVWTLYLWILNTPILNTMGDTKVVALF